MGLPGLMIPEEYGGSGLKVLEASLVAEQLGSYAVPSPWIGNSIMAPTAILFDRALGRTLAGFNLAKSLVKTASRPILPLLAF